MCAVVRGHVDVSNYDLSTFSTMDSIGGGRGLSNLLLCDWSFGTSSKRWVIVGAPGRTHERGGLIKEGGLCGYARNEHVHIT